MVVSHQARILGVIALCVASALPAEGAVSRTAAYDAPDRDSLSATGFADLTTHGTAPLSTTATLRMDDRNIYVTFHAEQAGVPITATQTTNNVGFGLDDYVGIGIDTSNSGQQVYYFEITPRGVRYQQSSESSRYEPAWSGQAKIEGSAWTATMTIPIRVLRTQGSSVQTWRFNFIRRVAAASEDYSWAYDPLMDNSQNFPNVIDARFWPALTNVHVAAQLVRLRPHGELYALADLGRDRRQFQVQPAVPNVFAARSIRAYGGDITYPITGSMAAVATLSPDFSNVETDQQTIAPQEFPRALLETRPFLAQGASFLTPNPLFFNPYYPEPIFYSPNVGAFDRGVKVEGTYGLQSLGAMEIKGAGFDDEIFGFKHALPDRSFLWWADGVAAHHASGADTATELGFEGRNLKNGFIYGVNRGMDRGTFVTAPGAANNLGAFVDVHRPNYEGYIGYRDMGPQYAPVDGYIVANDTRGVYSYVNLVGNGSGHSVVKSWALFLNGDRFLDRSGAVREADVLVNADITLTNLIHLTPGSSVSELRTYAQPYPTYAGGVTQSFNQHNFAVGYKDGTPTPVDVNYSWGPFSNFFLQQFTSSMSRPLSATSSISLEWDGTRERFTSGGSDGQWLRRISYARSLGPEANFSLGLRSVSGTGGFAQPGVNLAASYHRKFRGGNELYVEYGTPAAVATLQRMIVKYVMNFGGGTGT